ncbi:MAG: T9SS type A sorting domain-containing protein [Fibrobacterota bacterium]
MFQITRVLGLLVFATVIQIRGDVLQNGDFETQTGWTGTGQYTAEKAKSGSLAIKLLPGEYIEQDISLPQARFYELHGWITELPHLFIDTMEIWSPTFDWSQTTYLTPDNDGWGQVACNISKWVKGKTFVKIRWENPAGAAKPALLDNLEILVDTASHVYARWANTRTQWPYGSDADFLRGGSGHGDGTFRMDLLAQRLKALNATAFNYLVWKWPALEWPRFRQFCVYAENHGISLGLTPRLINLSTEIAPFARTQKNFVQIMADDYSGSRSGCDRDASARGFEWRVHNMRPDMCVNPVIYHVGDPVPQGCAFDGILDAIQYYQYTNCNPYAWLPQMVDDFRHNFIATTPVFGIYDAPHSSARCGPTAPEYTYAATKLAQQYFDGANRYGLFQAWPGDRFTPMNNPYFSTQQDGFSRSMFTFQTGIAGIADNGFEERSHIWFYHPYCHSSNSAYAARYKGEIDTTAAHSGRNSFKIWFPANQSSRATFSWNYNAAPYYGQLAQTFYVPQVSDNYQITFWVKAEGAASGYHKVEAWVDNTLLWSADASALSGWQQVTLNIDALVRAMDSDGSIRPVKELMLRVSNPSAFNIAEGQSRPASVWFDDVRLTGYDRDPILAAYDFDTDLQGWQTTGASGRTQDDITKASDFCLHVTGNNTGENRVHVAADTADNVLIFQYYYPKGAIMQDFSVLEPDLKQTGDTLFIRGQKAALLTPDQWMQFYMQKGDTSTVCINWDKVYRQAGSLSTAWDFGDFNSSATGEAYWDNFNTTSSLWEQGWIGKDRNAFNEEAFNLTTGLGGIDDLYSKNSPIIPTGNVEYVEKFDVGRQSLHIAGGGTAMRSVMLTPIGDWWVTFFYKYKGVPSNLKVWSDNGSGLALTQTGTVLFLNGDSVFELKNENVWYRLSLHLDRAANRQELYTDWRLRYQGTFSGADASMTQLGPLGSGSGEGFWDQIVFYQADTNLYALASLFTGSDRAINGADEKAEIRIFPNPFNPSVLIQVRGSRLGLVSCSVYDVRGRSMAVFRITKEGTVWNAKNLPGGLYLIRTKDESGKVLTAKAILMK